jgi:hypothetical protein
MTMIFKNGPIEIWRVGEPWGVEFYVYGVTQSGDPRACPSIGMAFEVAATAATPATSFVE